MELFFLFSLLFSSIPFLLAYLLIKKKKSRTRMLKKDDIRYEAIKEPALSPRESLIGAPIIFIILFLLSEFLNQQGLVISVFNIIELDYYIFRFFAYFILSSAFFNLFIQMFSRVERSIVVVDKGFYVGGNFYEANEINNLTADSNLDSDWFNNYSIRFKNKNKDIIIKFKNRIKGEEVYNEIQKILP